ncbi:HEAT repeat domain-containing protein [Azohydromonas caseinilytica]|uniref:HEAT repeat domain-containing protein n=1 Tax=Azohydromonas caseinilytica TaxID=2728836 RepID=A0A848F5L7_9BURK|nr:HEAT repeat domain-containing protein [Azohydromonas caseinilytica]NML14692.1 HEAT repeat domain-containing protein [Azohydromonas caseinilytica]
MAPEPLSQGQGLSPAAEPGKAVGISDGLLSLSVKNQALGSVLNEIGRQSGIDFHVPGEIAAHPVSVSMRGMPVEQGLARVLAHYDSIYYFAARNSAARSLVSVWVYPQGQGFAAGSDNGHRDAGRRLDAELAYRSPIRLATDADPAIRLQAISTLAEGSEAGVDRATARAALETALSDPDAQVRAQALSGLVSNDSNAAFAYQIQGLRDADPAVRLMAVETLAAEGEGRALLQSALNDPDEAVRQAARLQLEPHSPK